MKKIQFISFLPFFHIDNLQTDESVWMKREIYLKKVKEERKYLKYEGKGKKKIDIKIEMEIKKHNQNLSDEVERDWRGPKNQNQQGQLKNMKTNSAPFSRRNGRSRRI